ncbi:MAG: hypothetical protein ACJ735_06585 [Actinomycetes bacterium]
MRFRNGPNTHVLPSMWSSSSLIARGKEMAEYADRTVPTSRTLLSSGCALVVLTACSSGSTGPSALTHAQAACVHWAKLNAGIADAAQRQQESQDFQQEATAAAAAAARYKSLQAAAKIWAQVQATKPTVDDLGALRSAIDQARAACAGVPKK